MDPLSLTASIIAVLGAASAAVKAFRSLRHDAGAVQELLGLANEVSDVQTIFSNAQTIITSLGEGGIEVPSMVALVALSARVVATLDEVEQLMRSKPLNAGKLSHWKWLRKRTHVDRLRRELNSAKATLTALMACLTTTYESAVKFEVREIRALGGRNQQSLDMIHRETAAMLNQQQTLLRSLPISQNHVEIPNSLHDTILLEVEGTAGNASGGCESVCLCRCHKSRHLRSPKLIDSILGTLFMSLSTIAQYSSRRCSDKQCHMRKASSTITFTFTFPNWLVARQFLLRAAYASTSEVHLLLRFPKVLDRNNDLFLFAHSGDCDGLRRLFSDRSVRPNDVNPNGLTALHRAVWRDNLEACEVLLQAGADPTVADMDNVTPLDTAWNHIITNRSKGVRKLEELFMSNLTDEYKSTRKFSKLHRTVLGLSFLSTAEIETELRTATLQEIDCQDALGLTPLAWAAWRHDASMTRLLLKFGADPDIADYRGTTPLMLAAGNLACMRALLQRKAKVNLADNVGQTALAFGLAFAMHDEACINILLEYGAKYEDAIAKHIEVGDTRGLELALRKGLPYDRLLRDGSNVLHVALHKANPDIFRVLADAQLKGLDLKQLNSAGETLAQLASDLKTKQPELAPGIDQLLESLQDNQEPSSFGSELTRNAGKPVFSTTKGDAVPVGMVRETGPHFVRTLAVILYAFWLFLIVALSLLLVNKTRRGPFCPEPS